MELLDLGKLERMLRSVLGTVQEILEGLVEKGKQAQAGASPSPEQVVAQPGTSGAAREADAFAGPPAPAEEASPAADVGSAAGPHTADLETTFAPAASDDLAARLTAAIAAQPGFTLPQLGAVLDLKWQSLTSLARELLDAGRIRKDGNRYFPVA
ncbi:MAG: hypothetical protein HYV63_09390 [Candidatus Schekmanbacteria bacterium]|nr:hypothetical protein [Candidatus Schekmanbacteria bacterium]